MAAKHVGQVYRTSDGDTFTLLERRLGLWRVQWPPDAGEEAEECVGMVLDEEFEQWGCVLDAAAVRRMGEP